MLLSWHFEVDEKQENREIREEEEKEVTGQQSRKRARVDRSCQACRKAHHACESKRPCLRCRRLQIDCIVPVPRKNKRRRCDEKREGRQPNDTPPPAPLPPIPQTNVPTTTTTMTGPHSNPGVGIPGAVSYHECILQYTLTELQSIHTCVMDLERDAQSLLGRILAVRRWKQQQQQQQRRSAWQPP